MASKQVQILTGRISLFRDIRRQSLMRRCLLRQLGHGHGHGLLIYSVASLSLSLSFARVRAHARILSAGQRTRPMCSHTYRRRVNGIYAEKHRETTAM